MKLQNLEVTELNSDELKSIDGGWIRVVIAIASFLVNAGYRDGRNDR